MDIVGLGKTYAENAAASFEKAWADPSSAQEKLLLEVLGRNKDTWFGKKNEFDKIRNFEDLHRYIPIMTWKQYDPLVDKVISGEQNFLFAENVKWLIQSTGTTGKPKLIPAGDSYLNALQESCARLVLSFIAENSRVNSKILEGKILGFATSSILREVDIPGTGKVPIGYIDGVGQQLGGEALGGKTVPTIDVINATDWDARYYGAARESVGENVTVAGGAVTLLINLMNKIRKEYPQRLLKDFKDTPVEGKLRKAMRDGEIDIMKLWPNLKLVLHSLANPTPYRTALSEIFGNNVSFREGYGCTEVGIVSGQQGSQEGTVPYIDLFVTELVKEDDYERNGVNAERMPVSDAKVNTDYYPVYTVTGLYSYLLDDSLRCISSSDGYRKFEVAGRAEAAFNLAGEKMKEIELSLAVDKGAKRARLTVADFFVSATYGSAPGYIFAVEFARIPNEREALSFLRTIDMELKSMNALYADLAGGLTSPKLLVLQKSALTGLEEKLLPTPQRRLKPTHIDKEGKLLETLERMRVSPLATYTLS